MKQTGKTKFKKGIFSFSIQKNGGKQKVVVDCDLEDAYNTVLSRIMCNSQYGKTGQTVFPQWSVLEIHFSDRALYWLFKTLNETSALDAAALDSKFIKYVNDAKNKHNSKITKIDKFGHNIMSSVDADLYEIFAELEDIIKRKCTLQSKQCLQ